jgi:magnesium transporter
MATPENKEQLAIRPANGNSQTGGKLVLRPPLRFGNHNNTNGRKLTAQTSRSEDELRVETIEHKNLRWINIERADDNEVTWLHQNFKFNPLHLEDVTGRLQRPKIDDYEDYLFIVLHFPVHNKTERITIPGEIDVFVGPDYIITVHDGNLRALNKLFEQCKNNPGKRFGVLGRTPTYALYKVIDVLVDYCFPIMSKLSEKIEDIDDRIFQQTSSSKTIQEISLLRRDVLAIRRIMKPQIPILANLERRAKIASTDAEDLEAYFSDVVDHISRIWDSLEEYKDVIDGLSSTYDSLATYQLNQIIKALTIISVILLPLTLISGIYGMNVPLPLQENVWTFLFIILFMMMITAGMLTFFRFKRWL